MHFLQNDLFASWNLQEFPSMELEDTNNNVQSQGFLWINTIISANDQFFVEQEQ